MLSEELAELLLEHIGKDKMVEEMAKRIDYDAIAESLTKHLQNHAEWIAESVMEGVDVEPLQRKLSKSISGLLK